MDWSDKIQLNFNNASQTYDFFAIVQKKAADFLIQQLATVQNTVPKTILDLGTGTGYIPELLLDLYPDSHYYLNDFADQMLSICKNKFNHRAKITLLHDNMETLKLDTYDLITSNFAFQWVDNLWAMIEKCYRNTSHTLAFSTLINGTFNNWETIVSRYISSKIHHYPNENEVLNYCNHLKGNHTFYHWIVEIQEKYDTPLLFMRYLKEIGAATAHETLSINQLKALTLEHNQPIMINYKIFFGIFTKI